MISELKLESIEIDSKTKVGKMYNYKISEFRALKRFTFRSNITFDFSSSSPLW